VASKWNGVWYILAFAGLAIAWDVSARQAAGFRDRWAGWRRSDAKWLPLWFGLIPAVVYTASWAGWFATPYGYNRDGAVLNNGHPAGTIAAWLPYNQHMLKFGLGLTTFDPSAVQSAELVLSRPSALYSACPEFCGSRQGTEQEILAIGTPQSGGGTAAGLFCLVWWAMRRDWRAPACLPGPQAAGTIGTGAYLIAALANFAYLYPILTAKVIPYSAWLSRMWFSSWI
jgi:hypothetical protein